MTFRFILLILPALALGEINVELTGEIKGDVSNLKVYYDGNDIGIISNTERNTFDLNDNNLKNAVSSYFGKRPDDAYLRSPTPWGDLYRSYGWQQVLRTLKPVSGKILGISSKPTIVRQQIFENNSSISATFNVSVSQEVQNTVSSSWSTEGQLSIGQELSYGFNIEVVEVGGTTSFSYTSPWGQNTRQSQTVIVGATSVMEMVIEPGQAVVVQLHATRVSIKIQMEYDASLSGHSAVNYAKTYKGHHFWALDIGSCMKSAGLSNKKVSREVIDIGFYSDSKVIVHDKRYGNKIMEVAF